MNGVGGSGKWMVRAGVGNWSKEWEGAEGAGLGGGRVTDLVWKR